MAAKQKTKGRVWVLTAKTESGDEFGPWVFGREPSQKKIEAVLEDASPCDVEEGTIYETLVETELL